MDIISILSWLGISHSPLAVTYSRSGRVCQYSNRRHKLNYYRQALHYHIFAYRRNNAKHTEYGIYKCNHCCQKRCYKYRVFHPCLNIYLHYVFLLKFVYKKELTYVSSFYCAMLFFTNKKAPLWTL